MIQYLKQRGKTRNGCGMPDTHLRGHHGYSVRANRAPPVRMKKARHIKIVEPPF
jgi:hypothetical protein